MSSLSFEEAAELVWERKDLPAGVFRNICFAAQALFSAEPSVLTVASPCIVVGDIHGQFYDMREMIRLNGDLKNTKYVFLGDLVDRGRYSIECVSLLFLYKIMYPQNVFILRGNHETRSVSRIYGFYQECMTRFNSPIPWEACMNVFDHLPVAAVIDQKYFCVHGGLARAVPTVDELQRLPRDPESDPMLDLLWSDPVSQDTSSSFDWGPNSRGAGCVFGKVPTESFLEINGLDMVLRAHQQMQDGYGLWWGSRLATVWSAPRYMYRDTNVASVMAIDSEGYEFRVFDAATEREPSE